MSLLLLDLVDSQNFFILLIVIVTMRAVSLVTAAVSAAMIKS